MPKIPRVSGEIRRELEELKGTKGGKRGFGGCRASPETLGILVEKRHFGKNVKIVKNTKNREKRARKMARKTIEEMTKNRQKLSKIAKNRKNAENAKNA